MAPTTALAIAAQKSALRRRSAALLRFSCSRRARLRRRTSSGPPAGGRRRSLAIGLARVQGLDLLRELLVDRLALERRGQLVPTGLPLFRQDRELLDLLDSRHPCVCLVHGRLYIF